MKFENTRVWGFEHAFRGMRNPKNSWAQSDSYFGEKCSYSDNRECPKCPSCILFNGYGKPCKPYIGPKDMKLAQSLIKGGPEHRKFLRQIFVSVDITAPLYWWKEFDTYKVGTVANSTSTMHTIQNTPITIDSFETDDYVNIPFPYEAQRDDSKHPIDSDVVQTVIIPYLEYLRQKFNETGDKVYWKELIRWAPESWLQTRTVTMTYENLFAMCSKGQRRFHKLNEWSGKDDDSLKNFIQWVRDEIPYAQDLIFIDELETDFEKIEKMLKSFGIAVKKDGEYRSAPDIINDVAELFAGNWIQELKD